MSLVANSVVPAEEDVVTFVKGFMGEQTKLMADVKATAAVSAAMTAVIRFHGH